MASKDTTKINGTSKPADASAAAAAAPAEDKIKLLPGGRPDFDAHRAVMEDIDAEIAKLKSEMAAVRALLTGSGPADSTPDGKRRAELRTQLNSLRSEQAGSKGNRLKVLDEIKAIQEDVTKKINDLRTESKKLPFTKVSQVDEEIKHQEKLIESGALRIVEERQAIGRVTNLKKTRKSVATLEERQTAIDERKAVLDKLRDELKTLEADPAVKATSQEYSQIKEELDQIQARFADSAKDRAKHAARQSLLQEKIDELYERKRTRFSAFREARDASDKKRDDERRKRIERERDERKAHEASKREAKEAELREQAAIPAFTKEIEDIDVLINYFSGGKHKTVSEEAQTAAPALGKEKQVRSIEEKDAPAGARVLTKGKEEDAFFVAASKKNKNNKKKGKKPAAAAVVDENDGDASGASTPNQSDKLHVPFGVLSALLGLSIPPPTTSSDIPRAVSNLKLKRDYFVANQQHQTDINKANAEKLIAKNHAKDGTATPKSDIETKEEPAAAAPVPAAAEPTEA